MSLLCVPVRGVGKKLKDMHCPYQNLYIYEATVKHEMGAVESKPLSRKRENKQNSHHPKI